MASSTLLLMYPRAGGTAPRSTFQRRRAENNPETTGNIRRTPAPAKATPMHTKTISVDIVVPEVSDDMRSSAMAIMGTAVVGAICVLAAVRATWFDDANRNGAAISVIALAAVFVTVVRWVPALSDASMRIVPRRHAYALLGACVAVGGYAALVPQHRGVSVGVLTTLCLVSVYLACWGYRSLFLIRRIVAFSVLAWGPTAAALHSFVDGTLGGPSERIYQRLSRLDVAAAGDHPWRLYSAMTDRAAIGVICVIVGTLAISRMRMTLGAFGRLLLGCLVVMGAHHLVRLVTPLEEYRTAWWAELVTSPVVEILVAVAVVAALFVFNPAMRVDDSGVTAADDRDPEIFGVHNVTRPAKRVRFAGATLPAVILGLVVTLP
jgi:hypothetical protein